VNAAFVQIGQDVAAVAEAAFNGELVEEAVH